MIAEDDEGIIVDESVYEAELEERYADPYEIQEHIEQPEEPEGVHLSHDPNITAAEEEPEELEAYEPEPAAGPPPLPDEEPESAYPAKRASVPPRSSPPGRPASTQRASSACTYTTTAGAGQPLDSRALPEALRRSFTAPHFDVVSHDANPALRFVVVAGQRIGEGQMLSDSMELVQVQPGSVIVRSSGCAIAIALRR